MMSVSLETVFVISYLSLGKGNHPVRSSWIDRGLIGTKNRNPETQSRGVAQLGSALLWGSRGRRFKSCRSDRRRGLKAKAFEPFSFQGYSSLLVCDLVRSWYVFT